MNHPAGHRYDELAEHCDYTRSTIASIVTRTRRLLAAELARLDGRAYSRAPGGETHAEDARNPDDGLANR